MNILPSIQLFLQEQYPQQSWELSNFIGEEPYRLENVPYGNNEPTINIDYKPDANTLEVTVLTYAPTAKFKVTMGTIDLNDTDIQEKLLSLIT